MSTDLSDKTALVTGASRGIGRAIALRLARAGTRVLVHYGKSDREADAVVSEIRAAGGNAEAIGADLASLDGPMKLAAAVRASTGDRIDLLVANAGVSKAATIEETTPQDFDRLFAINVRAPFFVVQQLLPALSQDSSVVVVSSLAARAVLGKIPVYAATKAAVSSLVHYMAAALGERGIRVNAVAPGAIDTDLSSYTKTEQGRSTALAMQTIKRIGQPQDVADVVAFLASDAARFMTGAIVPVDGGAAL